MTIIVVTESQDNLSKTDWKVSSFLILIQIYLRAEVRVNI